MAGVTYSLAEMQERHHFRCLDHAQQAEIVRRLAAVHGEFTIANITGLAVEQIRRVLTDGDTA